MADQKYYLSEIAQATGIDIKTLQARRAKLVKENRLQGVKGRNSEYTYEEALLLLRKPTKPGEPRAAVVDALRRKLQTDGYSIKKG